MEKAKNTGLPYEALTQAIFQAIHKQEAVQNICVERDLTLQGKSTTHQRDVYWKFVAGGLTYETIVQAKDWHKPVSKGELLQLKGVLDELPGQPKGIFVTRKGYQRGARDVAKTNGIVLFELDEAPAGHHVTLTTLGWGKAEMKVMQFKAGEDNAQQAGVEEMAVGTRYTVYEPQLSNLNFIIDRSWVEQNCRPPRGNRPLVRMRPKASPDSVLFYDEQHSQIARLVDLLRQQTEPMRQNNVLEKHVAHTFEHPTFLGQPPLIRPSFAKVVGFSVDIQVREAVTPFRFGLTKIVQFVLREVGSSKSQEFIAPREPRTP
jgi:hypothetical protein